MIRKIREYAFSNEHSLQERRFLLSGVIGCAAILAVFISAITSNQGLIFSLGLVLAFLVVLGVTIYSVRSHHFTLGGSIIILLSNIVVLPIGYLMGGGLNSGAPLWFVIGILFVFVLFEGRLFWLYLIASALAFGVSVYVGEVHPELVTPLQENINPSTDSYIAMISVSVLIGILYRFRGLVLDRELNRAEEQTEEIEKLNEMQNSFFSSMSHEIRTPISTIIGLNEMTMREKQLPTEVMENTMNIQNASKMLLSLINDILDMSKIQSGNMQITPAPYDTSRMLSEITNLHWNRAMEKDLRFDIQVGKEIPPMLMGDETRIKQIITNLLTNAIKYTEEGSVILRFGGEKTGGNKFILKVEIEDTGIGIRKENIPYLFDAFRRVEGDDTKNIEGTGLGLSISKQLTEMMDGTITVNSIYTKGSTFKVEIPQEIVEGDSSSFRQPGIVSHSQSNYQQAFEAPNASVLIVDDNDLNRMVCQKLLRATKVHVDLAESGMECLEKTRDNHYDAIFMDHEMPQMDGIETLQKIRQQNDGLNRDTPIIALTANAGSDRNAFYLERGFAAYLSKPIQSKRLEELLLACLPQDLVERSYVDSEDENIHISRMVQRRPFLVTTDSICDLPENVLRENDIKIMPYYIETEQGRFRDMEEIDADNLQQLVLETNRNIHSSAAPVEEYERFFGDALTESGFVLHLSSSKYASNAYDNAVSAAESFGNVYVVDSGQISSGLGIMALRAAQLFRSGLRLEEVLKDLEQYQKNIVTNYLLPSLNYADAKHHTSWLPRLIISMFNTEPVFTVKKGYLRIRRFLMGYIRSTPDQFVRYCLKHKKGIKAKRLFVTFSGCSMHQKQHILEEIERYMHFNEVIVNKASATTFINIGPNSFGLIYEKEEKDKIKDRF